MRIALVNPAWDCSEISRLGRLHHHPPLELLYAHEMLLLRGIDSRVLDAGASGWSQERLVSELLGFAPTDVFFTTAPGYLFWQSAPRHLEVPASFCRLARLADLQANLICVGPHVSVAPEETLFSLLCDAAVIGEPEEVIGGYQGMFREPRHFAYFEDGELALPPGPAETATQRLPSLSWGDYPLGRPGDHPQRGPCPALLATDVEFSRGWPRSWNRCHLPFRSRYRERAVERVLEELGRLRQRGVGYVYFIDETFGLGGAGRLLRQMAAGDYPRFGARSRIDIWNAKKIDLLVAAGCAGLEFEAEVRSGEKRQAEGGPTLLERAEETLSLAARRLSVVEVRLLVPPTEAGRETLTLWRSRLGRLASRLVDEVAGPLPGTPWRRAFGGRSARGLGAEA